MPGKPGSGGPVPKPAAQRRRRNKQDVPVDVVPAPTGDTVVEDAPEPDPAWHPIAREFFSSLARSGQAVYYQPSDWAMARLCGEMMSSLCSADKPSAQMLASLLGLSTSLLATEGDRRRLRLELARGPVVDEDEQEADATVTDLRSRLGG